MLKIFTLHYYSTVYSIFIKRSFSLKSLILQEEGLKVSGPPLLSFHPLSALRAFLQNKYFLEEALVRHLLTRDVPKELELLCWNITVCQNYQFTFPWNNIVPRLGSGTSNRPKKTMTLEQTPFHISNRAILKLYRNRSQGHGKFVNAILLEYYK